MNAAANTNEEYIDAAVRIATNSDYRQSLSRTLRQRNVVLFENRRVVTEFERFFATALESNPLR